MNIGSLRKLVNMAEGVPDSTPVVTYGDHLHGPNGIYDTPTETGFIYICCAMGGCSWRRTPAEYFQRALFWDGR